MLKLSLISLILSLTFATQAMAAPRCVDIYSLVKKVKEEKAIKAPRAKVESVWGKDITIYRKMGREYKEQIDRRVPVKKRYLENNDVLRESLDWMISKMDQPEILNEMGFIERTKTQWYIRSMRQQRDSAKIRYFDFLRVSLQFVNFKTRRGFPDESGASLNAYFYAYAHQHFLVLPSHIEMTATHLNELMAEGIAPLGVVDKAIYADGKLMPPAIFFLHDMEHAEAIARRLQSVDLAKFKEAYWGFKTKISSLPENERHIYENLWFLLTHEGEYLPNTQAELGQRILKYYIRDLGEAGKFEPLHDIHSTNSDLGPMSKKDFDSYLRKLSALLTGEAES